MKIKVKITKHKIHKLRQKYPIGDYIEFEFSASKDAKGKAVFEAEEGIEISSVEKNNNT